MSTPPPAFVPFLRTIDQIRRSAIEDLLARLRADGFEDQTYAHNNVFAYLWGEGATVTELAERAGITKQSMSELVQELEDLGYVERIPHPTDGRARLVRFAPRGLEAVRAAERAFAAMEKELIAKIGERRYRDLVRSLKAVAAD